MLGLQKTCTQAVACKLSSVMCFARQHTFADAMCAYATSGLGQRKASLWWLTASCIELALCCCRCSFVWCDININDQHQVQEVKL